MTTHGAHTLPEYPGFNRAWWVKAPWAHPLWSAYQVILFDLTEPRPELDDPILFMSDATHEIQVWAIDPETEDVEDANKIRLLSPPNHVYQFKAESHADAEARCAELVRMIGDKELSPDTDFISVWDKLFADGVSLRGGPK